MMVFFAASWTHTKPSRELSRASAVAQMILPESESMQSPSSLSCGHTLMHRHLFFSMSLFEFKYIYFYYIFPHFFVLIILQNLVFSNSSTSKNFFPSQLVFPKIKCSVLTFWRRTFFSNFSTPCI